MCLYVCDKPSKMSEGLIVVGKKKLDRPQFLWDSLLCKYVSRDENRYTTPYQNKMISKTGWLFPSGRYQPLDQLMDQQGRVHGGLIHSYRESVVVYNNNRYYKSYAFGVEAYGGSYDMVSRAIYVPDADLNWNRSQKTIEKIRKLLAKGDRLTRQMILREFPHLKSAMVAYRSKPKKKNKN